MRKRGDVLDRIDDLMKKSGKMDKDLTEYIGLPTGTVSQWRRGNGDSYYRYIKEICDFFHVTPNYLFLGENGIVEWQGDFLTKEEVDIIECYRKATVKDKSYVKILLHEMAK